MAQVVRPGRKSRVFLWIAGIVLALFAVSNVNAAERLRVIIETDAGGDPDDEQSLVRFLLYVNEWDVEGMIANRPVKRSPKNLNPESTGLAIVQRLVKAYGECHPRLVQHDPRYPPAQQLLERTVPGYDDTDVAVDLLIAAADAPDPRPIWYSDWGTDNGAAVNNLRRALDRILQQRGPEGYARFKSRWRITGMDKFAEHTRVIDPPFPLFVDTFWPELNGKRWYHQFSAVTATAGGFDIERDCRNGHGPLGAMYPLNTSHPQKEGDSMCFLYWAPTGMNDVQQPTWSSWGGRYGLNPELSSRNYYWANQEDAWNGTTSRNNTLARWAEALQNDFRARLDWCVRRRADANHPPVVRLSGDLHRTISPEARLELNAAGSIDPDGQSLTYQWQIDPVPGSYQGEVAFENDRAARTAVTFPKAAAGKTVHVLLTVQDNGQPPLTRAARTVIDVSVELN